jgi:hypothetical protein
MSLLCFAFVIYSSLLCCVVFFSDTIEIYTFNTHARGMPWAPFLDVVAVLCCCDSFVSVMLCGIFFDTIEIYTFNNTTSCCVVFCEAACCVTRHVFY